MRNILKRKIHIDERENESKTIKLKLMNIEEKKLIFNGIDE